MDRCIKLLFTQRLLVFLIACCHVSGGYRESSLCLIDHRKPGGEASVQPPSQVRGRAFEGRDLIQQGLVFVDVFVDDSEYPNGSFNLHCKGTWVGDLSVYGLFKNRPLRFELSQTIGDRDCVARAIQEQCFTLQHDGRNREIESVNLADDGINNVYKQSE